MPPRDFAQFRALLACSNPIEAMDVSEYLAALGWGSSVVRNTGATAMNELSQPSQRFALIVVAVPPSDPDAARLVTFGVDTDCPVLVMDVSAAVADQGGKVVCLSRPYIDADLNAALSALGVMAR